VQSIKIKVTDKNGEKEKDVETRFVELETGRRITGAIARRVLQREFPEIGFVSSVSKTETGWTFQTALNPTDRCDYHFVWRHYHLDPA
jgi:hypothetical protein